MFPLLAAIRRWLADLLLLSLQIPSDWICSRAPNALQICRGHRRSRATMTTDSRPRLLALLRSSLHGCLRASLPALLPVLR